MGFGKAKKSQKCQWRNADFHQCSKKAVIADGHFGYCRHHAAAIIRMCLTRVNVEFARALDITLALDKHDQ